MSRSALRARGTYLSAQALARLSGVTPHKVKRYEAEGLFIGSPVITVDSAERLYHVSAVHLVRRIRSYEDVGVNFAGIEIILRLLQQSHRRGRR